VTDDESESTGNNAVETFSHSEGELEKQEAVTRNDE
jgi:hypothetical protein